MQRKPDEKLKAATCDPLTYVAAFKRTGGPFKEVSVEEYTHAGDVEVCRAEGL